MRTYYINVCRPLRPVPGCDRLASVCQIKYESAQVNFSFFSLSKPGHKNELKLKAEGFFFPFHSDDDLTVKFSVFVTPYLVRVSISQCLCGLAGVFDITYPVGHVLTRCVQFFKTTICIG